MDKLKKMCGKAEAPGCGVGHVNSGINWKQLHKFDLFFFVHI